MKSRSRDCSRVTTAEMCSSCSTDLCARLASFIYGCRRLRRRRYCGARGAEAKRAQDHGDASNDVRAHADDQRPLADADSVDEVDDLPPEEEEVSQDRDVVGAAAFPDAQRLRNVGGTGGDADDRDEPGEQLVE